VLLVVAMAGACGSWQAACREEWTAARWRFATAAAAMLGLLYAIAGMRWYLGAIVWVACGVFLSLAAITARRRRPAAIAAVVVFLLLSQSLRFGGGDDIAPWVQRRLNPRTALSGGGPMPIASQLAESRRGFESTPGATTITAPPEPAPQPQAQRTVDVRVRANPASNPTVRPSADQAPGKTAGTGTIAAVAQPTPAGQPTPAPRPAITPMDNVPAPAHAVPTPVESRNLESMPPAATIATAVEPARPPQSTTGSSRATPPEAATETGDSAQSHPTTNGQAASNDSVKKPRAAPIAPAAAPSRSSHADQPRTVVNGVRIRRFPVSKAPVPAVPPAANVPAPTESRLRSPVRQLSTGLAALLLPISVARMLGILAVGGGRNLWAFVDLDTIALDLVLLFGLWYGVRDVLRRQWPTPLSVMVAIVLVATTVTMAYTVTNFGTLFRLREMVYVLAAVLPLTLATAITPSGPSKERQPHGRDG
jgi:hypothetical protein